MEKGIEIKYIAAAMSEILGIDVPIEKVCIMPTESIKISGWRPVIHRMYLYLNSVLSAERVEKLAENIRDEEEKNMEERLNRVELKNGCISMIYEHNDDFDVITEQMHDIYIKKNHDYGNSFDKSMDEFGMTSAVIRMNDKLERLKTLSKKESMVKDESVQDTLLDLANYAIMTVMYLKKHEDKDGTDNE